MSFTNKNREKTGVRLLGKLIEEVSWSGSIMAAQDVCVDQRGVIDMKELFIE